MEERWDAIRGSVLRWEEMKKKVDNGEIESVNRSKADILRMKVD